MKRVGSLGDQLASAMAAVQVSGDWYPALIDAEKSYAEQPLGMPSNLGDLRKEQLIGEGGYSLVWLVRLGPERYALKQMHKAELASRRGLGPEVAFREKAAYEEIKPHPVILRCHCCFADERNLYILLELCLMDMYELIEAHADAKGRLPPDWARFYVASIALGLRHMHGAGYVYRDLKPENVLLDRRGFVKLTDMGAAKKVDKSRTFTALGTEEYIAPEQVRGRGRTIASDWWALGVLLYELLMGRPPFEGEDSVDTLKKVAAYSESGDAGPQAVRNVMTQALGVEQQVAAELATGLLEGKEHLRLGCTSEGFLGVANHPYFASLDWLALFNQQLEPPHIPDPGRTNTDFSAQVEPDALVAPPLAAEHVPKFANFGPECAVAPHPTES